MKIKCIEKKGYFTLPQVHRKIISNYIRDNDALGFYECKICLKFHLTSKYDNRTSKLKKKCSKTYRASNFKWRAPTNELIRSRMRVLTEPDKIFRREINRERKKLWKEKGWTKKNSTLSLDEQKKILATLKP